MLTEIRSLSTGYRRGLGNSGRATLPKLLKRFFHGPAWLTFLAREIVGGGFALCSFTLLYLFRPLPAKLNLVTTYGATDDSTAESFISSN